MKKQKQDPQAIINCGTPNEAYLAYLAMFRYAFGRMTYMPTVVIGIIKCNAEHITDRTLYQLYRELKYEENQYELLYKDKTTSNYGWECDRQIWIAFHRWVKGEIAKRKMDASAASEGDAE